MLGDFDLAEESLHEAFTAAIEQWQHEGAPANPRAWLVSTGRFKAVDIIRRRQRFDAAKGDILQRYDALAAQAPTVDDGEIEDDRLRLIFTCCHPAIASNVQVALTLREVCELTTDEIASAFLTAPATMAQRIARGKAKIRDAGIPFVVPTAADLPERLEPVLQVIYLVFNEGYSASSGQALTRQELSEEAIRLGRLLAELLPHPEVIALLSLMLLQESRRTARSTADGDLILLNEQDRSLWNHEQIREGLELSDRILASGQVGSYGIQAAIAAVHARAATPEQTNWERIVSFYDALLTLHASPVVELNRAVAVAMRDGADAGLRLVDSILDRGDLQDYHLSHAARADLLRRLGQLDAARGAYEQALKLARQEPERRFLQNRLKQL